MKSRIWLLTITAALITTPVYGAWTDTQPVVTISSAWQQGKVTVTTKVKGGIGYWTGPPEQQQPAVAPQAPAGSKTPASEAPKPAAPAAPVVQSQAAKELQNTPVYKAKAEGSSLHDVQAVQQNL